MIYCKLNIRRAEKRITQQELSTITGIRLQTISDMEIGKTKSYKTENLEKLCNYFNCNISDIIEYIPDNSEEQK